jgi:hypothetical protein
MKKLFKRLFKKQNMLRIYATRKENEVHELQEYIHELKAELLDMQIDLDNKNQLIQKLIEERDLYYNNLTPKKKRGLANEGQSQS